MLQRSGLPDCSCHESTRGIAEGSFPVASGKKNECCSLLSREQSPLMLQMSYGNGALFCFMRVCLAVHGVCCQ